MKKKTRLLKNIREEFNTHYRRLESSQEGKFTYYLMGLIIDHISQITSANKIFWKMMRLWTNLSNKIHIVWKD